MPPSLTSALTAIAALACVLLLIWLAARGAHRLGLARPRPAGRLLGIEETLALDQRRRLHLVRCGERQVLLLTGGASDLVLGWVPRHDG